MVRRPRLLAALGAAALVLCLTGASATASTAESSGPLIEHWNGTAWTSVPSPNLDFGTLYSVTAISADDVWAVGDTCRRSCAETVPLAEHWNGSSWRQVAVPLSTENHAVLNAVAATSGRDVWAVGFQLHRGSSGRSTLIEHWNGRTWKLVQSPRRAGPGVASYLSGVSALSTKNAWAVGWYEVCPGPRYCTNGGSYSLALHWNGKRWRRVTRPVFALGAQRGWLSGVAAVSAHDLWAAGTLVARWNGQRWKYVRGPAPASGSEYSLYAVAASGPKDAWAVGDDTTKSGTTPLAEHWNGHPWTIVPVPATPLASSASYVSLNDVAALSPIDAWAVGRTVGDTSCAAIVVHWDGHAWTQIPLQAAQPAWALYGVATLSPTDVWAVGLYYTPELDTTD